MSAMDELAAYCAERRYQINAHFRDYSEPKYRWLLTISEASRSGSDVADITGATSEEAARVALKRLREREEAER